MLQFLISLILISKKIFNEIVQPTSDFSKYIINDNNLKLNELRKIINETSFAKKKIRKREKRISFKKKKKKKKKKKIKKRN